MILAARLRAQADGNQVFLSSVTSELVAGHLPEGCSLVDLGPHRLKGLGAPERIFALAGPGVDAPPPVTDCPYRGLLAFEADDERFFFGREAVVADLVARGSRRTSCWPSSARRAAASRRCCAPGLVAAARAGPDRRRSTTPSS